MELLGKNYVFKVEGKDYTIKVLRSMGKAVLLVFQGEQRLPVFSEMEWWEWSDFHVYTKGDLLYVLIAAIEDYVRDTVAQTGADIELMN